MPELPTKEGQIKTNDTLNKIFVGIVLSTVTALFLWGQGLSRDLIEQKDTYDKTIAAMNGRMESMQKELNGAEGDISDLQTQTESSKDDLKSRIIHLEDWELFHNNKK